MAVEVVAGTDLAQALNAAIQPKLVEAGWGSGEGDEAALAEYIVLMLVNGKKEEQIATELAGDLLGLSPEDSGVRDFARWLFEQIDQISRGLNENSQDANGQADANNDSGEMDTDMGSNDAFMPNVPTGPRSMRNGNTRGGKGKPMLRDINKAMDRTSDSGIHRVRGQTGNERINTNRRGPPTGPRSGAGRQPRNNYGANIQRGLANMPNQAFDNQLFNMMPPQQDGQSQFLKLDPKQAEMMETMFKMMSGAGPMMPQAGPYGQNYHGNASSHRGQGHHKNNQRRGRGPGRDGARTEASGEGDDVEMDGSKREPANPEESICKYNLNCTNKECKFAHQSPAAPNGAPVDVNDVCTFGAACKNRKCVARHPSPATKLAHQSEQDCKFFPNCQNPRCPFKHPSMPLCRNGADCTTSGCKFTHVKIKCRFNPCLNRTCAFAHEEGQQGGFKDKVWVADSAKEHISDRKFVDEEGNAELVKPEEEGYPQNTVEEEDAEVIG